MVVKTIVVKGCNRDMCPYCKIGDHPFCGNILWCRHPKYQYGMELNLCDSNDGYEEGDFPMSCPL